MLPAPVNTSSSQTEKLVQTPTDPEAICPHFWVMGSFCFSFSSSHDPRIHSSRFQDAPVFRMDPFFFASSPRLSKVRYLFKRRPATQQRAAMPRGWDLDVPYLRCSKCRAPRRPAVPAPRSCGTRFAPNPCNLPHRST